MSRKTLERFATEGPLEDPKFKKVGRRWQITFPSARERLDADVLLSLLLPMLDLPPNWSLHYDSKYPRRLVLFPGKAPTVKRAKA